VQSAGDVVNEELKTPIADKANARSGDANCRRRRLTAALKKDRIDDVHVVLIRNLDADRYR
jgi:hypothetical protein